MFRITKNRYNNNNSSSSSNSNNNRLIQGKSLSRRKRKIGTT